MNTEHMARCPQCGHPKLGIYECPICEAIAVLNEKSDEELRDMVFDAHQEAAEEINDEGRKAQIAYLLWEACWSPD